MPSKGEVQAPFISSTPAGGKQKDRRGAGLGPTGHGIVTIITLSAGRKIVAKTAGNPICSIGRISEDAMIGRIIKTVANEVMRRRGPRVGTSAHPIPPDPLGGLRRPSGGQDLLRKALGRFMKR